MSSDTVSAALLSTFRAALVPTYLAGISDGEPPSVPQSPWAWLSSSSMNAPEIQGSDREISDWVYVLHMVHEWQPDQVNAEVTLRAIIEPVRAAIRAHIKIGLPDVARTRVGGAEWGFIENNGIWHRLLDITVLCREKVVVNWFA